MKQAGLLKLQRGSVHVAHVGKIVELAAGDVICREGEAALGLHVVLDGEAKVQINDRTRSVPGKKTAVRRRSRLVLDN